MSVNDILVQGAEPLFFLDYFACGKLDVATATDVIKGIAAGCEQAGCALIGGETAEMPGMYPAGEYDLAGFAVGAVEKDKIINGQTIAAGDVVLGLASSGAHSNGYSLVRKIIERTGIDLDSDFHGRPLRDVVLAPTRIYVKPMLALMGELPVKGMAHITGGGLLENIPRVLPANLTAVLRTSQLAHAAAVLLAAAGRQRGRQGNAPHLQLRHRHGGDRRRASMPTRAMALLHASGEHGMAASGAIETRGEGQAPDRSCSEIASSSSSPGAAATCRRSWKPGCRSRSPPSSATSADAKGLEIARQHGIRHRCGEPPRLRQPRRTSTPHWPQRSTSYHPDLVVLAGFMRILTPDFVNHYSGRLINIHPSLLPAFTGLNTHARALQEGVKIHGCTVHFVTPNLDHGPIIVQAAVPVLPGDTPKTRWRARVLEQEHRIYPAGHPLVCRRPADTSPRIATSSCKISEPADTALRSPWEAQ